MPKQAPKPSCPAGFYTATSYCAEESIGYLMKRVMMSIVASADRRLAEHDLTSAQWGPLMRMQADNEQLEAYFASFTPTTLSRVTP